MRRPWKKRREKAIHPARWTAGLAFAIGATALLVSMMPSARRYLRIRAM